MRKSRMKTNRYFLLAAGVALVALVSAAQGLMPPPRPKPEIAPPVFRPAEIRADEKPVEISSASEVAETNGLYRRVVTTIVFTNPNARMFEGELEFPIPEGASVCGYELEVNGSMVSGVVCEKEAARTAFENEKRKGVDPGVVEHVKGNFWKTRIYPLMPRAPRKVRITTVEPISEGESATVVEKDGDDIFVGSRRDAADLPRSERLKGAAKATIYWDASMSREGKTAADRAMLEALPEKGEWRLVVFRNVVEPAAVFTARAELLAAIDALDYDGGTCSDEVKAGADDFVFTDEYDADAAAKRRVFVRKLAAGEEPPAPPKEGRLLATAWAADYIADHAANAAALKAEFLALGRRYGVASPVTSLIVLETLEQYLNYKIEPPQSMSFHDEWVRRRAAEDDPIAAEKAKTEHRERLLTLWEERVKWWNQPVPPKRTPKSGVFEGVRRALGAIVGSAPNSERAVFGSAPDREYANEEAVAFAAANDGAANDAAANDMAFAANSPRPEAMMSRAERCMAAPNAAGAGAGAGANAAGAAQTTVTVAKWDPQTPYLKALDAAGKVSAYAAYLKERKTYRDAPSFYLDCAGWFFKAGEKALAVRIISNLSEMRLEDPALWRTMGWRLREAGAYAEAIAAFRHVLAMRGEEPQSKRDLALVLAEQGKAAKDAAMLAEAAALLNTAAFEVAARRSGRRGNDMQTSVLALEELNGLIAWCAANAVAAEMPALDAVYRRDMPLDLRIMLSWDTDETDVDLHVLEPDGEEAFYGHRRTSSGGFVSEDVTTGYGPEEYLVKTADKGVYRIVANYFASHQQSLTGAATVTATVYTGWARKDEERRILSFRLDKPKDKHPIGEIEIK